LRLCVRSFFSPTRAHGGSHAKPQRRKEEKTQREETMR
jgi:hypothetical protein